MQATVMSSAWVSSIHAQDFVTLLRLHGTLSMNFAKHFQEQRNAARLFHLEYASQRSRNALCVLSNGFARDMDLRIQRVSESMPD